MGVKIYNPISKGLSINYVGFYTYVLCSFIVIALFGSTYISNPLFLPLGIWTTISRIQLILLVLYYLMRILVTKNSLRGLFLTLLLGGLMVAINFIVDDYHFVATCIFVITIPHNIDLKILARKVFICESVEIIAVFILAQINIIENIMFVQRGTERYACGFASPNTFANSVLFLFILYAYYSLEKWNFRKSVFWGITTILIYQITQSRMALICLCISILFVVFYDKIKLMRLEKYIHNIAIMIFPVLSIINIGAVIYFSRHLSSVLYNVIDIALTGRLTYSINFYKEYGIKLFGQDIVFITAKVAKKTGEKWAGIDNSYLYILLRYGIVLLLVICLLYILLAHRNKQNGNLFSSYMIILFCVIGITENIFFNVIYNYTLLMIGVEIKKFKRHTRL